MKPDVRKWIVTFGGAGLIPQAPGTAGSFAAAAFVYLVWLATLSPQAWNCWLIAGVVVAGAATVVFGPFSVQYFGRKDPGPMVLDEVAGVCLTLFAQPIGRGPQPILIVLAGFISFRFFDILKPPPCRQLERLPAGWGILMDDLMAGVYANVACQFLLRLL